MIDPKAATRSQSAELELSEVYTALDVAGVAADEELEGRPRPATDLRGSPGTSAARTRAGHGGLVPLPAAGAAGRSRLRQTTLASFVSLCLAGDWLGSEVLNVGPAGRALAIAAAGPRADRAARVRRGRLAPGPKRVGLHRRAAGCDAGRRRRPGAVCARACASSSARPTAAC